MSSRPSVCPSFCMEQLASKRTDFHEFLYLCIFRTKKTSRRFKFHYNMTKIPVLHMKPDVRFSSYLVHFLLEWEMFQTKLVHKIKTHILCSIIFFFFENRAVYVIMWGKRGKVRQVTDETIQRMRIATWILQATNTHSEYCNISRFPTTTMVARTRLKVTLYVHWLYCSCRACLSFSILIHIYHDDGSSISSRNLSSRL